MSIMTQDTGNDRSGGCSNIDYKSKRQKVRKRRFVDWLSSSQTLTDTQTYVRFEHDEREGVFHL